VRSPLRNLDANQSQGSSGPHTGGRPPKGGSAASKKVDFHILEAPREVLDEDDVMDVPVHLQPRTEAAVPVVADGTPKKRKIRNTTSPPPSPDIGGMGSGRDGEAVAHSHSRRFPMGGASTPPRRIAHVDRDRSPAARGAVDHPTATSSSSGSSNNNSNSNSSSNSSNSIPVDALLKRLELVETRLAQKEALEMVAASEAEQYLREKRDAKNSAGPLPPRDDFQQRMRAANASAVNTLLRHARRPGSQEERPFSTAAAQDLARAYRPAMNPLGEVGQGTGAGTGDGSTGVVVALSELSFLQEKLQVWRTSYSLAKTAAQPDEPPSAGAGAAGDEPTAT